MRRLEQYIVAWWRLSRVPFLPIGILPLILGFVLARREGFRGPIGLYALSLVTVILIMGMAYYLGEWADVEGDRINSDFNAFSGGSRVVVEGAFPAWVPLYLGYGCLVGALLLVSSIYFYYGTGPLTFFLGGVGILSGFYYSNKPFRWAYRGVGEVLIGFCYSWLPIATGFYLLSGFLKHDISLLSIPVGLSIFNVILINEFPDEEADRAAGKRNLVVRHGKEKMADLYIGLSVLTGLSLMKVISLTRGTPLWVFALAGIPLVLILWDIVRVWQKRYGSPAGLHGLCRNTFCINLSITLILTIHQSHALFSLGR
jgi:1,4-dihydroxy-2-naphthoate polyprenyltransferase